MRRALAIAALLAACGEAAAPGPADAPEPAPTGAARWTPVRRPSEGTLLEHPARVVADSTASGEVGAPFRARVVHVHVRPGALVAAGDPVLDVVMTEVLDAAATVVGLRGRIAAFRARAEELERLRNEQLVDAARVFEQRAALAELEAEQARAIAVLRSASVDPADAARVLRAGAITLRAPSEGVVRSLEARLGETREPGGVPFARIVGTSEARIEVRSSGALSTASTLSFEGTDGMVVPLAPEPVARVVDPDDGMHVTWFSPRDPVRLTDGLRGRVRLALQATDLFEVPISSVVIETDGTHVFVRRGEDVERVEVSVVASSGASAFVRAPLRDGDLVAADPAALTPAEAP